MENLDIQKNATVGDHRTMKQRTLYGLSTLPSWTRITFILALFIFLVTSFILLAKLVDKRLVEIPRHGGQLVEGIIGQPRFINPVIAKSDSDRDLTELIYSGLLRATPEGALVPDLAKSYTVSPDGLTYTFILKDDLVWHDGVTLTSADIAFTIDKVRDLALAIKSPRRASWEGVEVTTPDDKTVIFHIKQPYAPFLDNATMGIIPKHIWENVPDNEFDVSYFNIEPIGSGPYRFGSIVRDNGKGLPKYYDLIAFKKFALGEPYITHLRMQFYGNSQELAQAYADHSIEQMHTIEPEQARALEAAGRHIERTPLPRVFALYFNQNQQPIFADKAVRQALDVSIDKDEIVKKVLSGYAKPIDGPLPYLDVLATTTPSRFDRISQARAILEKGGWVLNTANIYEKADKKKKTVTLLQFSLALPDVVELRNAAELIKNDWAKVGAVVTVKEFEQSTFVGDILAPRKYDVLFYGQIIGRVADPYPYWHSSQRNSPGLNVSLYTNKNVDKLLENARKENDDANRTILLMQFAQAIHDDVPAIFLYSPDFLYATSDTVKGLHPGFITTESERFLGVADWYVESERVWQWVADQMHNR